MPVMGPPMCESQPEGRKQPILRRGDTDILPVDQAIAGRAATLRACHRAFKMPDALIRDAVRLMSYGDVNGIPCASDAPVGP